MTATLETASGNKKLDAQEAHVENVVLEGPYGHVELTTFLSPNHYSPSVIQHIQRVMDERFGSFGDTLGSKPLVLWEQPADATAVWSDSTMKSWQGSMEKGGFETSDMEQLARWAFQSSSVAGGYDVSYRLHHEYHSESDPFSHARFIKKIQELGIGLSVSFTMGLVLASIGAGFAATIPVGAFVGKITLDKMRHNRALKWSESISNWNHRSLVNLRDHVMALNAFFSMRSYIEKSAHSSPAKVVIAAGAGHSKMPPLLKNLWIGKIRPEDFQNDIVEAAKEIFESLAFIATYATMEAPWFRPNPRRLSEAEVFSITKSFEEKIPELVDALSNSIGAVYIDTPVVNVMESNDEPSQKEPPVHHRTIHYLVPNTVAERVASTMQGAIREELLRQIPPYLDDLRKRLLALELPKKTRSNPQNS
jgi:hypothetical protein